MSSKNICLINDSFPPVIDGVATAVVNYAEMLPRFGDVPTVVTPYYPEADDSRYDFPVVRFPSIDLTKAVGYRAGNPFSPEILKDLEGRHFDLIHSHCPITSTFQARLLRERIRLPLVLTYHTKFDIDIANSIRSKTLQTESIRLLVRNISACDEVWTVSRGAGENLRSLGYQGDYIVMPNGVDLPRGRSSEEMIRKVTAGLPLPEDIPLFLYVGRMMWYKGIRITLDALKAAESTGLPYRMVFIGKGGDKEAIMQYAEELGLYRPEGGGSVLFLDPVYDREVIRAWYSRADLFLFPSTFDTNGLVVREAAACSLPSILVEGSCAAEDVTADADGFLIQENAASMAAVLTKLMLQPQAVKRAGEKASQTLYMSWEDSVRAAAARYEVVIDKFKSGGYPPHADFDDSMFSLAARIMDNYNQAQKKRFALREKIQKGRDSLLPATWDDIFDLFGSSGPRY